VTSAPAGNGVRVVVDLRPLQEPGHAPLTAVYLDALIGAYVAAPVAGESFLVLQRVDRGDPTERWPTLAVAGRRMLPPTPLVAVTPAGDSLVLGGASLGAGRGADRSGASGTVFHAAGSAVPFGASLPMTPGIPLVATLLDLAPWQLPAVYQRSAGARFGARLRRRVLRDAAAVIVGTTAVRRAARRLLRLADERIVVIPFAPRRAFVTDAIDPGFARAEAAYFGLSGRYLVYGGRFDARHDLPTLLAATDMLASSGRPADLPADEPWPPRIAVVGASPDDRTAIARAASRLGVGDHLAYAPALPDDRLAAIVSGARAVLVPVLADAVGLPAIEALALGVPVLASGVDGLPEIVGDAGVLFPPQQPGRLATAMASAAVDDRLHEALVARARDRAVSIRARTWADVARETRAVYAAAVSPRS